MTIEKCYQQLGGDYATLKKRLPGDSLIKKFFTRFLDDRSFPDLCLAIQEGRREEAFRPAHTLKGVCANLGFDQLGASAGKLTALLRPVGSGISKEAVFMMNKVKHDYEVTESAIRTCLDLENCSE